MEIGFLLINKHKRGVESPKCRRWRRTHKIIEKRIEKKYTNYENVQH